MYRRLIGDKSLPARIKYDAIPPDLDDYFQNFSFMDEEIGQFNHNRWHKEYCMGYRE